MSVSERLLGHSENLEKPGAPERICRRFQVLGEGRQNSPSETLEVFSPIEKLRNVGGHSENRCKVCRPSKSLVRAFLTVREPGKTLGPNTTLLLGSSANLGRLLASVKTATCGIL